MCISGPTHDLILTISNFLNPGISIYEVVKSCTLYDSIALNRPAKGNLKQNNTADISILKIQRGTFYFFDIIDEKPISDKKSFLRCSS